MVGVSWKLQNITSILLGNQFYFRQVIFLLIFSPYFIECLKLPSVYYLGFKTLIQSIIPQLNVADIIKMSARPEVLEKLFSQINKSSETFILTLKDAVSIASVSSIPEKRDDCIAMMKWACARIKKLGGSTELCDIGSQKLPDGRTIKLPPVILGTIGNDPMKPTVCVYGHLDVQPASIEDGWDSEPFELTLRDSKLYGRGASDDKGPVLAWLHAVEAYQAINVELPVNLKIVFEGMEESGSEGLEPLLKERKEIFFNNVDYVCISDNYWLGTKKPCLTYGLRGVCYFFVEITCAAKDLHSGLYGGVMNEGMSDLVYLLNSLVDADGNILIPHINDDVLPVTDDELKRYKDIDFNVREYKEEIGTRELLHNEDKAAILMKRWRFPSLSIHGIEGAYSDPGSKTVIPRRVVGKFSIRIVPNQTPEKIEKLVESHMVNVWKKRNTKNLLKVSMTHGGKPWLTDVEGPNFIAARKATQHVYGVDPDLTREGGSIPITLTLQEITNKSVILIPIGTGDDGAHSQNEKINVRNYIEGTKLLGAYLYEIAQVHVKKSTNSC
ncbi:hypothetical protein O3M35_001893 [Rhynocoris fuscipes]|uniref:Peptidase M20 dimerisation domain-containing protein n=1 Tax=Rhynocoris fuscipes TaxID=488301 RepID=A0AAW1CSS4_9HEMI